MSLSGHVSPDLGQDLAGETDSVIHVCLFQGRARRARSINISGVNEWRGEMAG